MSEDETKPVPKVVVIVDGASASLQVQQALQSMEGVEVVPLEAVPQDEGALTFDIKGKFERAKQAGSPAGSRSGVALSGRFGQLAALALLAVATAEPAAAAPLRSGRSADPFPEIIPAARRERRKSGLPKPPKKLGPKPQRGYGGPRR